MSININTDLYSIASRLNISTERLSSYGDKSIEDIAQAEAAQGNTQAAQILTQMISDPQELVKLFKLSNASNRYAILRNLSEKDLKDLLPMLEKEDLVAGLNFFTKDKLLQLLEGLPKDQLVKYVFQMFSPEQVMKLMPEHAIDKVLQSKDLDKGLVLKHLKKINPEILAQMIEAATGQAAMGQQVQAGAQSSSTGSSTTGGGGSSASGNQGSGLGSAEQSALIAQIAQLSPGQYKDALVSMPEENKRAFVLSMAKEDPKVYELFDASAYTKLLSKKEKPDLVKSASSIEPEQLIKMIKELPQDLLSVVVTQIDPSKFADVLVNKYQDILKEVVLS